MRDVQQNAGGKGYGVILSSLNAGTVTRRIAWDVGPEIADQEAKTNPD